MANKLGLRLLIQMVIVIAVIFSVFYFIISTQSKDLQKQVFDKAKVVSLILGTHLERIVDDNLFSYRQLQESISLMVDNKESLQDLRIIAPEGIILAAGSSNDNWQNLEDNYQQIFKEVKDTKKSRSIIQSLPDKELIIHFMPLISAENDELIGIMQATVEFLPEASSITALRTNKTGYFRKESLNIAKKLADNLQFLLNNMQKNFNYLDGIARDIASDPEIEDIRLFSADLKMLVSGSGERGTLFISSGESSRYSQVMNEKDTKTFPVKGHRDQLEIISPIYLSKQSRDDVLGAVSIVFSLKQIQNLIEARRNNILFMSLVVIGAFFLLIGYFFRKHILIPLSELVSLTESISKGDLTKRSKINYNDEIGELAASFNAMIEELAKSKSQIEEWNLHLQEKAQKVTDELKQKQAQLLESEKLASLGVLSSGIAHEINNPLGIILGHAQMLLKQLQSEHAFSNPEEAQKLIETIEENTKRCSQIVKSLLLFARSRDLVLNKTDVKSCLDNALKFTESRLNKKNIKVLKNINQNLPVISADPIQLEQVFINILHNCEQSLNENGTITITAELKIEKEEQKLNMTFEDNGKGMPEKVLAKVFDPFFSTREPGEGTGLGLSISYGIIKAHQGDIDIKSKLGEGTTVTISLPI